MITILFLQQLEKDSLYATGTILNIYKTILVQYCTLYYCDISILASTRQSIL